MWLEMRMAWSSSETKARNSSRISSRTTGSKPAVASSNSSRRGRWASAAARDSFIRIPRDSSLMFFAPDRPNLSR